jgi:hypothetical protein
LDGRTVDGSVGLALTTAYPFTGTLWILINQGDYFSLECLGNVKVPSHRFLSADPRTGVVSLVADLSGANSHWKLSGNKNTGYNFEIVTHNYLDGVTANNAVKLSPATSWPYTGTWWRVEKQSGDLSGRRYVGCYKDTSTRDLNGKAVMDSNSMTVASCDQICSGFKYFGVQYGSQCFCGNTMGTYGAASDSDCSNKCQGNNNEMCGGTWRNSIYASS